MKREAGGQKTRNVVGSTIQTRSNRAQLIVVAGKGGLNRLRISEERKNGAMMTLGK
jgi:hypothetical protein